LKAGGRSKREFAGIVATVFGLIGGLAGTGYLACGRLGGKLVAMARDGVRPRWQFRPGPGLDEARKLAGAALTSNGVIAKGGPLDWSYGLRSFGNSPRRWRGSAPSRISKPSRISSRIFRRREMPGGNRIGLLPLLPLLWLLTSGAGALGSGAARELCGHYMSVI